jgi:predicted outer membrane repeat protein
MPVPALSSLPDQASLHETPPMRTAWGVAIYAYLNGGSIQISWTMIADNGASFDPIYQGGLGGGIYVNSSTAGGHLLIDQTTVSSNYSVSGGGGLYIAKATVGSIAVRNCTVSGNSSNGNGGGLYTSTAPLSWITRLLRRTTLESGAARLSQPAS